VECGNQATQERFFVRPSSFLSGIFAIDFSFKKKIRIKYELARSKFRSS